MNITNWLRRHGLTRAPARQAVQRTACLIARCGATTPTDDPGPGWHLDDRHRLSCPEHPPATSCRICGQDKGSNRIVCVVCTYTTGP